MTDTKEDPPPDEPVKLTPKQEVFVQEYLIDLNATQAAIRAGYTEASAPTYGSDLLLHPEVSRRIEVGKAQRQQRIGMTQNDVLHEMSLLANSRLDWFCIDDMGQVALTEKAPEGAMGAVQSIKRKVRHFPGKRNDPNDAGYTEYDVELKLWDKPTPLKLMGRHVGLFPDRMEHTGPNGGPIETVQRVERVIVDTKDNDR